MKHANNYLFKSAQRWNKINSYYSVAVDGDAIKFNYDGVYQIDYDEMSVVLRVDRTHKKIYWLFMSPEGAEIESGHKDVTDNKYTYELDEGYKGVKRLNENISTLRDSKE